MSLPYHPRAGTLLVCDYSTGFRAPEMIKRRLCITVSPKLKHREELVTVVPLSSTRPNRLADWHCQIDQDVPPPWGPGPRWAKCDMVATVGYTRLNLPHTRHPVTHARQRVQIEFDDAILAQLRYAVACALGMTIENKRKPSMS